MASPADAFAEVPVRAAISMQISIVSSGHELPVVDFKIHMSILLGSAAIIDTSVQPQPFHSDVVSCDLMQGAEGTLQVREAASL